MEADSGKSNEAPFKALFEVSGKIRDSTTMAFGAFRFKDVDSSGYSPAKTRGKSFTLATTPLADAPQPAEQDPTSAKYEKMFQDFLVFGPTRQWGLEFVDSDGDGIMDQQQLGDHKDFLENASTKYATESTSSCDALSPRSAWAETDGPTTIDQGDAAKDGSGDAAPVAWDDMQKQPFQGLYEQVLRFTCEALLDHILPHLQVLVKNHASKPGRKGTKVHPVTAQQNPASKQ